MNLNASPDTVRAVTQVFKLAGILDDRGRVVRGDVGGRIFVGPREEGRVVVGGIGARQRQGGRKEGGDKG